MALFEISPELQLLAKPVTPGWHGVEITKIEDKIKDDGTKQTVITHKVIDGPHKGVYIWQNISHDQNMAYNLRYLDFISKGAFLKPVKSKEQRELTMANIVRQFDAKITNAEVDGRTLNNIRDVRNLTSEASKKAELEKQAAKR